MTATVLVAGASGLVGAACVDAFLDDGWDVVAVSRRTPEVFSDRALRHVPLDLEDSSACERELRALPEVTHLVYTAVHEKPGLVAGWSDADQMARNDAMLRNILGPLAPGLRHATLLQGAKAYGIHRHAIPVPARERSPRDDHQNFYWLQEDHLRKVADAAGFVWTILRPTVVVGPTHGVAMNLPPVIGAYAAICREEGRPFGFPGGLPYVSEAVDVRLVARAARWAATAPQADRQHYNLTNGEVFGWRDLWPALADVLGVEPGPDDPVRLGEFLPARSQVWESIVRKHGLRPLSMAELVGESHHYADYCFAYGAKKTPWPAFLSTVQIKQAGFSEVADTEESFRHWLRVLMDRRILPSATA